MRLIDADKLYDTLEKYYKSSSAQSHVLARNCLNAICEAPTVEVMSLESLAGFIVENLDPRVDCKTCATIREGWEDRECANCPKMSDEEVLDALKKWMEAQNG